MNPVDIIAKKRDRLVLTPTEINFFIQGFVRGEITDYQMSAWLMAIRLNGMTDQEATALTLAMAGSGEILDLSSIAPLVVDKHSTGGVGDKTTLVVEPTVAACGIPVGKMSGRGLGFSGGTLDKLESIPGFRTNLTTKEFLTQLKRIGLVLSGQSSDLAPADGLMYALRDVTATVESIPLIASSIMSKKIASGANAIVLDVKVGSGAFMKNLNSAHKLARLMVSIAKLSNRQAVAILANMNEPLGNAVGNALEVREAIDTLHGSGPADFQEHCLTIASRMLVLAKKVKTLAQGRQLAIKAIDSGQSWQYFRKLVKAQGGDLTTIDQPDRLPTAPLIKSYPSPRTGYLKTVDALTIAQAALVLGAGRTKKTDSINPAVGLIVHHKVGDQVKKDEPLFTLHAQTPPQLQQATELAYQAHRFSRTPVKPLPLFFDIIV